MDKSRLFVGSLPWSIDNNSLRDLFAQFGEITDVFVVTDRDSGRSKGFGFITFAKEEDAQKALDMNGKDVEGRTIVVNVAKPKEDRGGYRRGNR